MYVLNLWDENDNDSTVYVLLCTQLNYWYYWTSDVCSWCNWIKVFKKKKIIICGIHLIELINSKGDKSLNG